MAVFYANKPVGAISYKDKTIKAAYYGGKCVYKKLGYIEGKTNITHVRITLYGHDTAGNVACRAIQFKINDNWKAAKYEATETNKKNLIFDLTYDLDGTEYKAQMSATETCWNNTMWGVNSVFMEPAETPDAPDFKLWYEKDGVKKPQNTNTINAYLAIKGHAHLEVANVWDIDLSAIAAVAQINGIRMNNSDGYPSYTTRFCGRIVIEVRFAGETKYLRVYKNKIPFTESNWIDWEPMVEFTRDASGNFNPIPEG